MNESKVVVSNLEEFELKKQKFVLGGFDNLHVLSDFDKTLTKAIYSGNRAGSLISHLRNGRYLSEDYAKKAHKLFDKYHPIEIDLKIDTEEKKFKDG